MNTLGQHLILGLSGPELTAEERSLYSKIQPAGFILFTRNIVDEEQTRRLTDSLREIVDEEPIIAIDQEGGRVTRTKDIAPSPPSARELRENNDWKLTAKHGVLIGEQLALLGINRNFAPVLDICRSESADNSLRGRCFGTHSQQVIDNAGLFNRWMRKQGVFGCGKHFPSCSYATVDPHHGLPVSEASLEQFMKHDVLPYTALGPELSAIMTCHVHFSEIDKETPGLPASLSSKIIDRFLRQQLGFDHQLVITDDLDMGAIIQQYGRGPDVRMAIEAGNDLALICHNIPSAEEAVAALQGLNPYRHDETLKRLKRFRKRLKSPIAFHSDRWERTSREIQELRDQVPILDKAANSPVEDY